MSHGYKGRVGFHPVCPLAVLQRYLLSLQLHWSKPYHIDSKLRRSCGVTRVKRSRVNPTPTCCSHQMTRKHRKYSHWKLLGQNRSPHRRLGKPSMFIQRSKLLPLRFKDLMLWCSSVLTSDTWPHPLRSTKFSRFLKERKAVFKDPSSSNSGKFMNLRREKTRLAKERMSL